MQYRLKFIVVDLTRHGYSNDKAVNKLQQQAYRTNL